MVPGLFAFAFVRDPWDRLVSCYRDKIGGEVEVRQVWYDSHIESDTAFIDPSDVLDVPWVITYTVDVLNRVRWDWELMLPYLVALTLALVVAWAERMVATAIDAFGGLDASSTTWTRSGPGRQSSWPRRIETL